MVALSPESRRLFDVGRDEFAAPSGAKERTRRKLFHAIAGAASVGTIAVTKTAVAGWVVVAKWTLVSLALSSAVGTGYFGREILDNAKHVSRRSSATGWHNVATDSIPRTAAVSTAQRDSALSTPEFLPAPALVTSAVSAASENATPQAATSARSPDATSDKTAPQAATSGKAASTDAASAQTSPGAMVASERSLAVTPMAEAPKGTSELTRETAMIRGAHRALVAGNAQLALRLLDEHAAEFPHAHLAEEQAAARILAQCQLKQRNAAQRGWNQFVSQWPRSPLLHRLHSGCRTSGIEFDLSAP